MHRGRVRQTWTVAAHQMALLANLNRNPRKQRALRPTDFMPVEFARELKKAKGSMTGKELRSLKPLFQKKP